MKLIKWQVKGDPEGKIHTGPYLHPKDKADYLTEIGNSYFTRAIHWTEDPGENLIEAHNRREVVD